MKPLWVPLFPRLLVGCLSYFPHCLGNRPRSPFATQLTLGARSEEGNKGRGLWSSRVKAGSVDYPHSPALGLGVSHSFVVTSHKPQVLP